MADIAPQRSVFREPAAFAALLCVAYVAAGILWMVALESSGGMDPDVDARVMSLFVLATTILVFPCAFVVASVGLFLLSKVDWNRPWRAGAAGVVAASILYSGLGTRLYEWCESWESFLPLPSPLQGILMALTPVQAAVFAGCLVGWSIPPWRGSRVPQGGGDRNILPPGASQIAK